MKKNNQKKIFNRVIYLVFCIVLILVGQSFIGEGIKFPFSIVFNPIYVWGSSIGSSVDEWKKALLNASSYINEFEDIKEENAKLKIENAQRLIEYEEYISLKENSSIAIPEKMFLEAKILNHTQGGTLIINRGKKDGIKEGDIVVLGSVFIGTVSDVSPNTSLVRLPFNNGSSYEVVVIPSNINLNTNNRVDSLIKSSGVVIGSIDNIKIENMGINSSVTDGDTVLIRDERIGDVLILGTLIGVSKNPASTYKAGFVSPIFDYSNILTVFVNIE